MFGIHIPNLCKNVKVHNIKQLFKQLDIGFVGPILLDNQYANVYIRKLHDNHRSNEFRNIIMDPNKKLIVLYNNNYLEFQPLEFQELYADYL
tara:strand:+ start:252 stop:527 length:276 start_codon:yes stop_codon:yes gene_type:complete